MAALDNPAIPKDAWILVTGANGLVGSHAVDEILGLGFRVRGAVRDTVKCGWMTDVFDEKYGKGRFELVGIPDMAVPNAFTDAIKGTSAFLHTAAVTDVIMKPREKVIDPTVNSTLEAIKAAYAEPSVKRFVYTSSVVTAAVPECDQHNVVVTQDTFNEKVIEMGLADEPPSLHQSMMIYGAAKTLAEKAVWDFYRENQHKRPDLAVNTVLPNVAMGNSLDPVRQGFPTTSGVPPALWNGDTQLASLFVPQYFVNTIDIGLLHAAAAIHPDVKGERIFGFSGKFNWDMVLDIMRKQNPDRKFIDNFSAGLVTNEFPDRVRAEQWLRDLGRPGWTSLEETIRMNTEQLK